MHISCERCATVYILDDKLIPPGGAPVQCTRCGLVFTAYPAQSPTPATRSAPPAGGRREAKAERRGLAGGQEGPGTQIFGGPTAGGPSSLDSDSATLFGPPNADAGSGGTRVFGSQEQAAREGAQKPGRTSVFGAPARAAKKDDADVAGRTMMFGSAARPSQQGGGRTVIFGAGAPPSETPAAPPREVAPAAGALDPDETGSSRTIMFGAPKPSAAFELETEPMDRSDRTLMFGKSRGAPAASASIPTQSETPRAMQMSGTGQVHSEEAASSDVANLGAPAIEIPTVPLPGQPAEGGAPDLASDAQELESSGSAEAPLETSLVDGPPADVEGPAEPAEKLAPVPAPMGRPPPRGESAKGPSPVAVWPQRSPASAAPPAASGRVGSTKAGAQTMQLQLALKKSQRRLPMIVGAVAIALVIGVGVAAFLALRTPKADPAIVAADQSALNLMKRDDATSLRQAIAAWQAIQAKAPSFLPAQANQIMAYTLLAQDLGEEIRRLTAQAGVVQREMKRLEEKRDPPDFAQRANEKREELVRLNAQMEPLVDEAQKADKRAGELITQCKQLASAGPDGAAVFRASALYFGMKGNDNAERLAEVYRKSGDERGVLHDDARAFADLAIAAFYAQPRTPQEKREKGTAAIDAVLRKDSALLRARLLQAKILLSNRDFAGARKVVGEIVAANAAHLAAARLMYDIELAAARPDQAP